MITTTVMRRVLAKLEAAKPGPSHWGPGDNKATRDLCETRLTLRRLQANDALIADLASALNFETRGVGV